MKIPVTSQQAWLITATCLYSTDHWIGGTVAVTIGGYYAIAEDLVRYWTKRKVTELQKRLDKQIAEDEIAELQKTLRKQGSDLDAAEREGKTTVADQHWPYG